MDNFSCIDVISSPEIINNNKTRLFQGVYNQGGKMKRYYEDDFLILTKTYPTPSKSYRETVCVAAVNASGEMRRLYPITYRFLQGNQQFFRWQWIKAKVARSSDRRPESYNIDNDSIILGDRVGTSCGWIERLKLIKDFIYPNFTSLEQSRIEKGTSLGYIKPINLSLIIKPAKQKEWNKDQLQSLKRDGLWDTDYVRNKPIVKKIPFDIYYEYKTQIDDTPYRHIITDWEIGALFWNCQRRYGGNWEQYFRKKLEDDFRKKDLLLLMGTMHQFPDQWLIVGIVYPPKSEYQYPLFLTP